MWIDCDEYECSEGQHGYLVEIFNTNTGKTSFSLRDRPLRTNQSHEPRLSGWCGETDNRSRHARGVWRVVRTNQAGNRAKIAEVSGEELATFLEKDGYPELAAE